MILPPRGHARTLVLAALVNTFGSGAYLTTSVFFLTRCVGLGAGSVAAGLAVGAATGLALATPVGALADRYGAALVQIVALVGLAACFTGLLGVTGVVSFAALACLIAVGEAAVKAANGALVATTAAPRDRVRVRALVRAANNAGMGLGTLVGGLALLVDSRPGYVAVLLLDAVTFLVAAGVLARAKLPSTRRAAAGPRFAALRDAPFLTFALVDGFLQALYNGLVRLGLPLWLVGRAAGPLWLVSAALLVNTVGCVLLQVWATRGVAETADAARLGRRGALVVGGSCLIFGLAAGTPVWAVVALILVAAVVHVLGEVWLSTATWAVVFGLAPDWAQGQYQGGYLTGRQIGDMLTPPLVTLLVVGVGRDGWWVLGSVFAAAGLVYPAIVNWGLRTHPALAPA
jgi:MFS family permease